MGKAGHTSGRAEGSAIGAGPAVAVVARPAPLSGGVEARSKSSRTVNVPSTRVSAVSRAGALVQTLASLLWLPQAGLLAFAVQGLANGRGLDAVLVAAAGVLILGVLRAVLDNVGARMAFRQARAELTTLRERAVAALAARSPLDRDRPASGLAASAIAEQAEAVQPYLARYQPVRLRASIVPLAILVAVFPFSWISGLILVVAAPLIPLFMALIGLRAKEASEKQMLEVGGMNGFLLDRLRGLTTIRAFDAVDATANRLRRQAEELKTRTMAVLRIAFLSSAVLELFAALGVAMVAVYIGFHLLGQLPFGAWGYKLSLGEGLFVLLLAPAFFEPLRDFAAVWHDRAGGEAALASLAGLARQGGHPDAETAAQDRYEDRYAVLASESGVEAGADHAAGEQSFRPTVALRQLTFRHAGSDAFVLDRFSLTVEPGETVALMGPSGCGKSTLLALIAGLVRPDAGEIVISGLPLNEQTAGGLRDHMAWIGQQPHLLAGSLRGNITFGRPTLTSRDVTRALQVASIGHIAQVRGAPDGTARIGEGGNGLSGGEALRLALARAAANPHASLVLADEPTAHLDSLTANDVMDGLLAFAQGKTLIVATHDPVLAARMDRVVKLGELS